jgi:threonine dehydrogenase-like Zn-dependent dehydrogenase
MMVTPEFVGGGRVRFVERAVPEPGEGQLLLRLRANALCGSERGQFQQGSTVTPGHEAAGEVAAAGPGAETPVGANGVVFLMDFCGVCRACRLGFTNQCHHKRGDFGFSRDGGYGPYALVRESAFFTTGDVAGAEATLLLDVMGTGGHAVGRACLARPDIESLLISGAGPIGLGALAMAKLLLGHSVPVAIADYDPIRLKLAEELGGLPVALADESLDAGLARAGVSPDAAIDTTGKQAARQSAMAALARRGVLVCVGHGEGLTLDVSSDLIAPERAVLGSEYFRFDELPGNLLLFHEHRDYLRRIITHRFPAARIEEAFETFFAGGTGKVVIEQ